MHGLVFEVNVGNIHLEPFDDPAVLNGVPVFFLEGSKPKIRKNNFQVY